MQGKSELTAFSGKIFLDGNFTNALGSPTLDVIDPATEDRIGQITDPSIEQVETAVAVANAAYKLWNKTNR
jgi:aldehyde dehydrogenase (NAD+)